MVKPQGSRADAGDLAHDAARSLALRLVPSLARKAMTTRVVWGVCDVVRR